MEDNDHTSQAAEAEEQPEAACGRCGSPQATQVGDEWICDACYIACGSCCADEV